VVDFPFQNEAHQARFEAGRALTGRGGAMALHCGARTRRGGTCQHAPLVGHARCLRHAGPKAARAYRQRQYDEMRAGKISYAEFARSEAKRAANRLRDQWKKDPWVHGRTIDLLEHELAFQSELLHWNGSRRLAPAILDWLRWKFRRLQIDRAQDAAWALLLRDELPRRVRNAGDPPEGWTECPTAGPAAWEAGATPVHGKRARGDAPRRRKTPEAPVLPAPSNRAGHDPAEVAKIVSDCRDVLVPLLALCASGDERSALAAALVNYVSSPPGDPKPRKAWQAAMAALRSR
jgi:hypothetical protein